MLKEQKGITLVALVITIIILVILVGVTVSVAINQGLINNSKTAAGDYKNVQTNEANAINWVDDYVNNVVHSK